MHWYRATSSMNFSLLTLPGSTPAIFTTNKRLLCCKEALNHGSEFKILWDTFRSQIAELWFPYDRTIAMDRRRSQTIADDRRRSQMIAEDRTWFYLLRSSAITITGSQTTAEVCFHMIADDRRTFCDLRSAIRDRLRSYGNQPLRMISAEVSLCIIFRTETRKCKSKHTDNITLDPTNSRSQLHSLPEKKKDEWPY